LLVAGLQLVVCQERTAIHSIATFKVTDDFIVLFLDGWAREFHDVAPEKQECQRFHHFEDVYQEILGAFSIPIFLHSCPICGSKLAATV